MGKHKTTQKISYVKKPVVEFSLIYILELLPVIRFSGILLIIQDKLWWGYQKQINLVWFSSGINESNPLINLLLGGW